MRKILTILSIIGISNMILASEIGDMLIMPDMSLTPNNEVMPDMSTDFKVAPLLQDLMPTEEKNVDVEGNERKLEKNFGILIDTRVNVFVPLEVVSDIDIEATVFENQIVEVPFEIELNKEPEKKDYYKIKYSEENIDIDNDGNIDTFIHSPEFANTRYIKDNYVEIHGENISQDGDFKKKVYITVEAGI